GKGRLRPRGRRTDKARAGPARALRRAAGAALEADEDLLRATSARCRSCRPLASARSGRARGSVARAPPLLRPARWRCAPDAQAVARRRGLATFLSDQGCSGENALSP